MSTEQDLSQEEAIKVAEYFTWLLGQTTYSNPKYFGDGRYGVVMRLAFHSAIVVGKVGDYHGYDDRWCYADHIMPIQALEDWDGTGEPEGWRRHPNTGRRREEADPEREYIAW